MASMEIHGGQVAYELPGPPGGQPIVLTPRRQQRLRAMDADAAARGAGNIFDPWVHAAPLILDFVRK